MMRSHFINRFLLIFTLFLVSLLACQKEEVNRPFARVRTLPVTGVDSTGATFNAEIIDFNEEEMIDHGFIWTTDEQNLLTLPPEQFNHQSLGTNPVEKIFTTRIEAGLQAGTTYFVRAYLRSAKRTVYGEAVQFIGKGSFAPVIEKVLPEILTPGDTMTIIGNYFIDIKEHGKVLIGQEKAEIITATPTEIRCIVPHYITSNTPFVVQSSTGQNSSTFLLPDISTPELNQLIPNEIVVGDTITITGRYFSPRKDWNEVISEGTGGVFRIVSATKTKLQFIAYVGAFGGTARLQVRIGGQISTTGLDFSIAAPVIEDFYPKQGTVGDTLTIIGRSFYPDKESNRIFFNDVEGFGYVISSTKQELKVLIQELDLGLRESLVGRIGVMVGGRKATSQASFTYINKDWKRIDELPTGLSYNPMGFVLQDKLYFSNDGSVWWNYDLNSRNWRVATQIPSVGNEGFSTVVALTVGEEAFVIQRNTNDAIPLRFWRYRPVGNQWIRAANLEISAGALVNDPLVAFSVGQEVFLCLSGRENPCFKLNVLTDTWSSIASYIPLLTSDHDGYTPVPLAAVSFNQKGYLLSPQGGPRLILEYYVGYNGWIKAGDYPYPNYPPQQSSFVFKDKIYFISLNTYRFLFEWDPITRRSRSYQLQSPPTDVNFGEGQVFVLSDRVFFAIGKYLYEWFPR